ncbi:MAG TPA: hypothetical protein V6D17_17455 [Candidatus Obscuribacterales bacterium]
MVAPLSFAEILPVLMQLRVRKRGESAEYCAEHYKVLLCADGTKALARFSREGKIIRVSLIDRFGNYIACKRAEHGGWTEEGRIESGWECLPDNTG